jgi:signal transduction histidine kinase
MTLIFVVTTSALLALDAAWSARFMYSTKMDAIRGFLEHETQEFAHDIAKTDGSIEQIRKVGEDIASISHAPPCAFRIRNHDGEVLVQAGDGRLLALPYPHRSGWRDIIFGSQSSSLSIQDELHDYQLEVIADVRTYVSALTDYLTSAMIAFLVSVALAGLAGWYGANRGLRGLREVVRGAGDVVFPTGGVSLDLEDAPREVRDVGVALEGMIKRVDSGMDSMRTFTAGLAHELRSPLQSLIGRTEVSLLKKRPADEYEQTLRGNLDDLHSLSDSVDNMVALCRSASPKRQIHPTHHFDLAEESQLRLERERASAERAGIQVRFRSQGDTHLTADRESVLRIVRNLASNAIQWTPAGRTVSVGILGQTNTVDIEVLDEGPGIPEEMAEKMFTAFVTGLQRVGRRSGYGLGLAICKSVVDEHHGSIEFSNRPEGGARFYVTIPRSPPMPTAQHGDGSGNGATSLARDAGEVIGRDATASRQGTTHSASSASESQPGGSR